MAVASWLLGLGCVPLRMETRQSGGEVMGGPHDGTMTGHHEGFSEDEKARLAKAAIKRIAELEGWHTAWQAGGQPTVDKMLDERNEMKQRIRMLEEALTNAIEIIKEMDKDQMCGDDVVYREGDLVPKLEDIREGKCDK